MAPKRKLVTEPLPQMRKRRKVQPMVTLKKSGTKQKSTKSQKYSDDHGHIHHGGHDVSEHDHSHFNDEHANMDVHKWSKYYKSAQSKKEHYQSPHECLLKYEKLLLGGSGKGLKRTTVGKHASVKILVPLCGKAFDMKYLAERGHGVIGVEYAQPAVEQFFKHNKLSFTVDDVPTVNGKVYTCSDKGLSIKIYNCDFFNFAASAERSFDAIWDAGAMHALPRKEMKKYVGIMKKVVSTGVNYLLEFVVPSCSVHMTLEDIRKLFGSGFEVRDLGFTKTDAKLYKTWGCKGFQMYHIVKK